MARRETEHEIQSAILEWLEKKGIFHWRNNTGAFSGEYKGKRRFVRFGVKGAPDIFCVVDGSLFGIEVKRPGKEMSEAQDEFRRNLIYAGARFIVAYSLDDVTRVLES